MTYIVADLMTINPYQDFTSIDEIVTYINGLNTSIDEIELKADYIDGKYTFTAVIDRGSIRRLLVTNDVIQSVKPIDNGFNYEVII